MRMVIFVGMLQGVGPVAGPGFRPLRGSGQRQVDMSDTLQKFHVVLSGRVLPEADRNEVLIALARTFLSTPEKMQSLLMGRKTSLKKAYTRSEAVAICKRLEKAGAECRFEPIPKPDAPVDEPAPTPDAQPDMARETVAEQGLSCATEAFSADHPHRLNQLALQFVDRNTGYYRRQFSKFGESGQPRFRLTWHWPAFFFFFIWALYRKLWAWGAIYFITSTMMTLFVKPGIAYLLWALLWPVCANFIYFRHVSNHAEAILAQPAKKQDILGRGGVSRAAAWIAFGLLLISTAITSRNLPEQIMQQYGDQSSEASLGPESQRKGDGSVASAQVDSGSESGRISSAPNYPGIALMLGSESRATRPIKS